MTLSAQSGAQTAGIGRSGKTERIRQDHAMSGPRRINDLWVIARKNAGGNPKILWNPHKHWVVYIITIPRSRDYYFWIGVQVGNQGFSAWPGLLPGQHPGLASPVPGQTLHDHQDPPQSLVLGRLR